MSSRRCATAVSGLLALLIAALPAASAADLAAPSHPFLFELRGFIKEPGHVPIPPPEGEFEDACGVALDAAGDIYISDYYHHTIDVYNHEREYLTQIVDPDPDGPCNLAVDSAGDVYVNNWHRDVVKFTPSEFPPTEATEYGPATVIDFPTSTGARSTGVAVDSASGDLYVDDRTYVAVYEAAALSQVEPAPLRTFGLGTLGSGYGVAVSDFPATEGDVYVPDAATGTVRVFGPSGALIDQLDGAGTPQRGFVSLLDSDVAIDQTDGHVFVADNTERGFESAAAVVDEFNASGDYRGQLSRVIVDAEPTALAVDGSGVVYASSGNTEEAAILGFGPTIGAQSLEVTKSGEGEGTVTSEPAGINCGSACAAEFNAGEEVVLTAVPGAGSTFAGWSGCEHPAASRCNLIPSGSTEVDAEFDAQPQPLSLQAPGESAALPSSDPPQSAVVLLKLAKPVVGGSTAIIRVTVPTPGTLSALGRGVRPSARLVSAGKATLRLHLNRAGKRALAKAKLHRISLRVTITFRPSDGTAASALTKTVTFKQQSTLG